VEEQKHPQHLSKEGKRTTTGRATSLQNIQRRRESKQQLVEQQEPEYGKQAQST
jgi:hypothetical protein